MGVGGAIQVTIALISWAPGLTRVTGVWPSLLQGVSTVGSSQLKALKGAPGRKASSEEGRKTITEGFNRGQPVPDTRRCLQLQPVAGLHCHPKHTPPRRKWTPQLGQMRKDHSYILLDPLSRGLLIAQGKWQLNSRLQLLGSKKD